MKTFFKIIGALVLCLVLIGAGFYGWASIATSRSLARTFAVHSVDFPIPFPLSMEELAAVDSMATGVAGADSATVLPSAEAEQIAMDRAIERGRHLVSARYACVECHGSDFGGGVMVDAFPIGTLLGPNITTGTGSRTLEYTAADWDRTVRHGVRPDGTPSAMPSEDFQLMSDQELSDIVAYIRSFPPVDEEVPPISLGPLGKILLATGALPLSADKISSHTVAHEVYPPPAEVSAEFGKHIAGTCTGCHGANLAGGPIPGGDPSWVAARNLTPHQSGIGSWSYEDFTRVMREGIRPDGSAVQVPMTLLLPYSQQMTEVEMEALWTYLRSVPPVESVD